MKKYVLSLILGCGIVLCSHSVYAQIEDTINESESIEQKTCGENCAYVVDDRGLLLIKPIDSSKEARIQEKAFRERKDFVRTKIDEGIVSIGDFAFYETNLTNAKLPNTLISIGNRAFYSTNLRKIDLPNTLNHIGEYAFYGTKLKKIKIPASITTVKESAFECGDLQEVILPENLEIIEEGAFKRLTEIIPSLDDFMDRGKWKLTYVTIPDKVTSIGDAAFANTDIRTLNLSKSLKTIGKYAFYGTRISEKLNIPDSVMFIDDEAFGGLKDCHWHPVYNGRECEYKLSNLIISDTTAVSPTAFGSTKIDTVYCRGDLDTCKENLEDAVPETTVFKSVSELDVKPETAQTQKKGTNSDNSNKIEENNKKDNLGLENISSIQTVDKNILADEDLMKTITPKQLEEYIAQGANVNARDKKGWTPLMFAAVNENVEIVEMFFKYGADINNRDISGGTALHLAALLNKNSKIVETLIKHGADINIRAENGDTALHGATLQGNPEIVETLLKYGANIEAKMNDNYTPLMLAAKTDKDLNIVKLLLKYNTDNNDINKALVLACGHSSNPKVIQALIDALVKQNGYIISHNLLKLLNLNINIEKNQEYWDLRDRIYNATNR